MGKQDHSPDIDGSRLKDNEELWKIFDYIRQKIRTDAMHSFTKKGLNQCRKPKYD
jgi:hypothetical protein